PAQTHARADALSQAKAATAPGRAGRGAGEAPQDSFPQRGIASRAPGWSPAAADRSARVPRGPETPPRPPAPALPGEASLTLPPGSDTLFASFVSTRGSQSPCRTPPTARFKPPPPPTSSTG